MLAFRLLIEDRKHSAIRKIMEVMKVSDVSDDQEQEFKELHTIAMDALRGCHKDSRRKSVVMMRSPKRLKPRQSERLSSSVTAQTSNTEASISELFSYLDSDDERSNN